MYKNDFDLGSMCKFDDIHCWRSQIKQKFKCNPDDIQCWKEQLKVTPCRMGDLQCWKNACPLIPCFKEDMKCWESILPPLPCKLDDMECWQTINPNQHLKKWDKPPKSVQRASINDGFDQGFRQAKKMY